MKRSQSILSLVLIAALIGLLGFTTSIGWNGDKHAGSARNILLGLDLSGGVSVTYQVDEDDFTEEEMADTIYKLQKRVEQYSTEATVYREGNDRVDIEIPGVSDADAILEELGKPGSLYFVDPDGNTVLEGSDVETASVQSGSDELGNTEYSVELDLTDDGTEKFAEATEVNVGNYIAIIYDDELVSYPTVNEAITGGVAYITGDFTYEEADQLASTIRIGGLALSLTELRSNVVSAQLGETAINTSLIAGGIGLALILIFLIAVYMIPGLAAALALLIYVGLVLVVLNAFDITLTLPGIAGIILGIGMAVDANVIIFARVKEELIKNRSVKNALHDGFHKALSAIIDGNVTTLIAAVILYFLGSGSIRGFAQTLGIGIIISMITALAISRWLVYAFYGVGLKDRKFYCRKNAKSRKSIDFVSKRKYVFAISAVLIVIGIGFVIGNAAAGNGAFAYSLEFEGGTATTATLDQNYDRDELDEQVVPVVKEATDVNTVQITKDTGSDVIVIKTTTLDLEQREALSEALTEEFDATDITTENISATISNEMRDDAILAVIIAIVCMLIYIWIRFKDIRFSLSAIAALTHDVLIVLMFYAVSRIQLGNTFIACMLTIVGYSINSTIVIFDRIRENLADPRNTNLAEIVNSSITSTLTRSIYTSLTTFVMVAVLFVLGVSSIQEFAAPLMVGILAGTYSSICLAGILWYLMRRNSFKINGRRR